MAQSYFGSTLTDLQGAMTAERAMQEESRRQAAAQLFQMMNATANRAEARRTGDLDRGLRGRTLDEEMAYRGRELGLRGRIADNDYTLGGRKVGIDQDRNEVERERARIADATARAKMANDLLIQQGINEANVKAAEAEAQARGIHPSVITAGIRSTDDANFMNFQSETAAAKANSMLKPHADALDEAMGKTILGWTSNTDRQLALKNFEKMAQGIEATFADANIVFDPRSRRFKSRPIPVPNYFAAMAPTRLPAPPTLPASVFATNAPAPAAVAPGRSWRRLQ